MPHLSLGISNEHQTKARQNPLEQVDSASEHTSLCVCLHSHVHDKAQQCVSQTQHKHTAHTLHAVVRVVTTVLTATIAEASIGSDPCRQ